jgi:hypothetical protein
VDGTGVATRQAGYTSRKLRAWALNVKKSKAKRQCPIEKKLHDFFDFLTLHGTSLSFDFFTFDLGRDYHKTVAELEEEFQNLDF